MKILLILAVFSLLVPAYMGARLLRRASDDLHDIATELKVIRYTLNPESAMRGQPAPERVSEEKPDIQL